MKLRIFLPQTGGGLREFSLTPTDRTVETVELARQALKSGLPGDEPAEVYEVRDGVITEFTVGRMVAPETVFSGEFDSPLLPKPWSIRLGRWVITIRRWSDYERG